MNLKDFNNLTDLFFFQVEKQKKESIFLEWLNTINRKKFTWSETLSSVYKLTNILKKNKIQYGFHYPKSINQLECFKNYFKGKKFDNAEKLAKSCISIPIDPNLKLQEIKKIVNCVNSI